jgi:hypothetical protein
VLSHSTAEEKTQIGSDTAEVNYHQHDITSDTMHEGNSNVKKEIETSVTSSSSRDNDEIQKRNLTLDYCKAGLLEFVMILDSKIGPLMRSVDGNEEDGYSNNINSDDGSGRNVTDLCAILLNRCPEALVMNQLKTVIFDHIDFLEDLSIIHNKSIMDIAVERKFISTEVAHIIRYSLLEGRNPILTGRWKNYDIWDYTASEDDIKKILDIDSILREEIDMKQISTFLALELLSSMSKVLLSLQLDSSTLQQLIGELNDYSSDIISNDDRAGKASTFFNIDNINNSTDEDIEKHNYQSIAAEEVPFGSCLKRYNQDDFDSTANDNDINDSMRHRDSDDSNDALYAVSNDMQFQPQINRRQLSRLNEMVFTQRKERGKELWKEILDRDTSDQREKRSVLKKELKGRIAEEFDVVSDRLAEIQKTFDSSNDVALCTVHCNVQDQPQMLPWQKYQQEILAWHKSNTSNYSTSLSIHNQTHPNETFIPTSNSGQPYCPSCFTRTGNKFHKHGVPGLPKCQHGRPTKIKQSTPSTPLLAPQAAPACITASLDDKCIEEANNMSSHMQNQDSSNDANFYYLSRNKSQDQQQIELRQTQQHEQLLAWQTSAGLNVSSLLPAHSPLNPNKTIDNTTISTPNQLYCPSCFERTGNKFNNHGVFGKPKCAHGRATKIQLITPPTPQLESVTWRRSESLIEKVTPPIPLKETNSFYISKPEMKPCYNILRIGTCAKDKKCEFSHDKEFLDRVRPHLTIVDGQIIANTYGKKNLSTTCILEADDAINGEFLYNDVESNDRHRIVFENLVTMRETSLEEDKRAEKVNLKKLAQSDQSNLPHCPSCLIRTGKKFNHGVPGRPPCNHSKLQVTTLKPEISDKKFPEIKPCYNILRTGACVKGTKCEFSHDKEFLDKVRPHLIVGTKGQIVSHEFLASISDLILESSIENNNVSDDTRLAKVVAPLAPMADIPLEESPPISPLAVNPSEQGMQQISPEPPLAAMADIPLGETPLVPPLVIIPVINFFNDVDLLLVPLVPVPPPIVPPTILSPLIAVSRTNNNAEGSHISDDLSQDANTIVFPLNQKRADDVENDDVLPSDAESSDRRHIIRENLRKYLETMKNKPLDIKKDHVPVAAKFKQDRAKAFKIAHPEWFPVNLEKSTDTIDEVENMNPINDSAVSNVSPLESGTISEMNNRSSKILEIPALPSILEYHRDELIRNKTASDSEIYMPDIYQGGQEESNQENHLDPLETDNIKWVLSQLGRSLSNNDDTELNIMANPNNITTDFLYDEHINVLHAKDEEKGKGTIRGKLELLLSIKYVYEYIYIYIYVCICVYI